MWVLLLEKAALSFASQFNSIQHTLYWVTNAWHVHVHFHLVFYLPFVTFTFITRQLLLFLGATKPLLSLFTICHPWHPLSFSSNVGKLRLFLGRWHGSSSTFTFIFNFNIFIFHFHHSLSLSSLAHPRLGKDGTAAAVLLLSFLHFYILVFTFIIHFHFHQSSPSSWEGGTATAAPAVVASLSVFRLSTVRS